MFFAIEKLVVFNIIVLCMQHIVVASELFLLPSDPLKVHERSRRSLTTICVEIKPSSPLEKPYVMCGSDLPTSLKKVQSTTTHFGLPVAMDAKPQQNYAPPYGNPYSPNFAAAEAFKTQSTDKSDIPAYGNPVSEQVKPNVDSGAHMQYPALEGFRGGQQQQQFFPPKQSFPFGYQEQQQQSHNRGQDPKHQSPAPIPQFAIDTRFQSNGSPDSYSEGRAFAPTKPVQTLFEPQNTGTRTDFNTADRSGDRFYYGSQPYNAFAGGTDFKIKAFTNNNTSTNDAFNTAPNTAVVTGPGAYFPSESNNERPIAGSNFNTYIPPSNAAPNIPVEFVQKSSYGQPISIPFKTVEAATAVQHANAQVAPSSTNVASTPNSATHLINAAKSGSSRHRSMMFEDVFGQPDWGFSPEEFLNIRDDLRPNFPLKEQMRNVPADYMDDPVLRQFYAPIHEQAIVPTPEKMPFSAAQPLFKPTQPLQIPNTAMSTSVPKEEPTPQLSHNAARAAQSAFSQLQPVQKHTGFTTGRNYGPDIASCCSQIPYTPPPLRHQQPCDTNYQRGYNFQPIFIALPCYGQQPAFGNMGTNIAQFSYPSNSDSSYLLGPPGILPNLAMLGPNVGAISPTATFYQMSPVGNSAHGIGQNIGATQGATPANVAAVQQDRSRVPGSSKSKTTKFGTSVVGSKSGSQTIVSSTTEEEGFEEDSYELKPTEGYSSKESSKDDLAVNSAQETDTTNVDSAEVNDSPTTAKSATNGKTATNKKQPKQQGVNNNMKPTTIEDILRLAEQVGDTPQMEEETKKSFDSLMSLAKIAKNFNKKEFNDTVASRQVVLSTTGKTAITTTTAKLPDESDFMIYPKLRDQSRKRQSVKSGVARAGTKRRYVQRD